MSPSLSITIGRSPMIFPGNNWDTFAVVRTLPIQAVERRYVELDDSDQRIFTEQPSSPVAVRWGGHPPAELAEPVGNFQYLQFLPES